MSTQEPLDPCKLMADDIKGKKQRIERDEARLEVLKARLTTEQAKPKPDPDRIAELKSDIEQLEYELKGDRTTLAVLEEDYSQRCFSG